MTLAPLSGDPLQMTASGNSGATEKGHNLPLNKETSSLLKRFPPSVRPHRAILPLNAKVSPIPLKREGGKEREQQKKRRGEAGEGHTVTGTLAFPGKRLNRCTESAQQQPTELSLMRACMCKTEKRACARQSPCFPASPLLFLFKSTQGLL